MERKRKTEMEARTDIGTKDRDKDTTDISNQRGEYCTLMSLEKILTSS